MKKCICLIILSFALLIVFTACANEKETTREKTDTFDSHPDSDIEQVTEYNNEEIEKPMETEQEIKSEYQEEEYSLNNPFVKVAPYDAAPLTALIMFETEEETEVTITFAEEEEEQPF